MNAERLTHRDLLHKLSGAGPDDPLWPEFVRRFQGHIRLVVFRTFHNEASRSSFVDAGGAAESVEDLTQNVFLKLLDGNRRAIAGFRGQSEHSIFTYLNAIAVNVVRDHFKKLRAQKTPRIATSLDDGESGASPSSNRSQAPADRAAEPRVVSEDTGPEQSAATSELRERIAAAIDEAAPSSTTGARDRLVFRLFFIEGLTVDEIAAVRAVGLSPSGVEKCIRRIRESVKKRISRE